MNYKTDNIDQFITKLSKHKEMCDSTNLYQGNSLKSNIRRHNLELYFNIIKKIKPSILLLGEAPGHKGCRLTGIPFTSEKVLKNNDFFKSQGFRFVNKVGELESEISATIIWNELENYSEKPLIWNILPFHPHEAGNVKTNRTPTETELKVGKELLEELLKIFNIKKIIALGRKPESQIADLGIDFVYVRHPANGGKKKFSDGLKREMKKNVVTKNIPHATNATK